MELNRVQFAILDALYFVEPYSTLLEEVDAAPGVIAAELHTLIHRGYVQVMVFDEAAQDYVKTPFRDTDNLHAYRYLATKQGLLAHNGSALA